MGCVMGSKNLKAIIIKSKDHETVPVADEEAVSVLAKQYRDAWNKGPGTLMKREYGTLTLMSQKGECERIKNESAVHQPRAAGCL